MEEYLLKNHLIERIVEEKDCNKHERSNLLTNAGIYCFSWKSLSKIINTLKSNNKQKEIYLTDTIALLKIPIALKLKTMENFKELIIEFNYQNAKKLFKP